MSCNCPPNSNKPCCPSTAPNAADEALDSQVANLIGKLFGFATKSIGQNGEVTWTLPCNLDGQIAGFPRLPGEGLLCYFLRFYADGITGAQGIPGIQGPVGPHGLSAYSTITAPFPQPTVEAPLFSFGVEHADWVCPQMILFVTNVGWARVEAVTGNTVAAVLLRAINAPPATVPAGGSVAPTGPQGFGTVIQPTVATPTFSLAGGTYTGTQQVTLNSATAGAVIYYTISSDLDGVPPSTVTGTVYTGPITVDASKTIRAFAVKGVGFLDSSESAARYTIRAVKPVANPSGGDFDTNTSVLLSSATPGATIRYTLNGQPPSPTTGTLYVSGTGIPISTTTVLQAIAYKAGLADSEVLVAEYALNTQFTSYFGNLTAAIPTNSQVESLTARTGQTSITGSYNFGAFAANTFQYFAFPAANATPRLADGFFLTPFPFDIAGPAQGYTEGPVNGWYYLTINGRRVFRSLNRLEGNVTVTVNAQ